MGTKAGGGGRRQRMAVRDIMTTDVVTLGTDMTLRDAAIRLSEAAVSDAPALSASGRIAGVVSTTDILDYMAWSPLAHAGEEYAPAWDEDEAESALRGDATGAGFYTDLWSDAGTEILERFRSLEPPEWDALAEHTVAEAMTRAVEALPPDADAGLAARRMLERGIHRVLVMDGDALLGIVSTTDFLRQFADDAEEAP